MASEMRDPFEIHTVQFEGAFDHDIIVLVTERDVAKRKRAKYKFGTQVFHSLIEMYLLSW